MFMSVYYQDPRYLQKILRNFVKDFYTRIWQSQLPANTRRCPAAGFMVAHRLRRCPNIKPTVGQSLLLHIWMVCYTV